MAFFEEFSATLKNQWLKYFEDNRDWLNLHTKLAAVNTPDGGKRPPSYFILGVMNALEPKLAQLMLPFSQLNPDPDTLIEVIGLNFDPDIALGRGPTTPASATKGVQNPTPVVPPTPVAPPPFITSPEAAVAHAAAVEQSPEPAVTQAAGSDRDYGDPALSVAASVFGDEAIAEEESFDPLGEMESSDLESDDLSGFGETLSEEVQIEVTEVTMRISEDVDLSDLSSESSSDDDFGDMDLGGLDSESSSDDDFGDMDLGGLETESSSDDDFGDMDLGGLDSESSSDDDFGDMDLGGLDTDASEDLGDMDLGGFDEETDENAIAMENPFGESVPDDLGDLDLGGLDSESAANDDLGDLDLEGFGESKSDDDLGDLDLEGFGDTNSDDDLGDLDLDALGDDDSEDAFGDVDLDALADEMDSEDDSEMSDLLNDL
ncbi:DUF5331 domain-containing protein [Oscillatoria acuminata]|uniref:DUF5331 domain-containing protein n=1 Tax=Oscillatoria acuminata PCC 6304 TaxID=56110 RepID=K9TD77_9CYAN|nr:DUF5331 domain-containing protein [Oscillatoria acuminata]AFY79964.1 hypothetical protein Oscil6304_0211 [Oscillatoria acuminata PCC 6304]